MKYIAFIRGINVGSSKRIKMDELKSALKQFGFYGVDTYIQSGNIVFQSDILNKERLVASIKKIIMDSFGFDIECVVKTFEEMQKIVRNNPFKTENTGLISVVLFNDKAVTEKSEWENGEDKAALVEDAVYLLCRTGLHLTKLNISYFEKNLRQPCTSRNWKTVNEILNY